MKNSNLLLIFSYITIFILCLLGNVENQDTSALSKAIDQFAAKLYGKSPNKSKIDIFILVYRSINFGFKDLFISGLF